MVRSPQARRAFVRNLQKLLSKYNLDGVDYNWEYPGYNFGSGYLVRLPFCLFSLIYVFVLWRSGAVMCCTNTRHHY